MKTYSIYCDNSLRNYNHYFISKNNLDAYIFDPLKLDIIFESLPSSVKNLFLLNTHDHPDHISKNNEFMALKNAKHLKLKNNEIVQVSATESIKAIYTPGHHKDHICYLVKCSDSEQKLVSGDTIFNCGVGHCKMKGANVDQLFDSIKLLMKLDDNIIVLPSHDYFLTNLKFAKTIEDQNLEIDRYIELVEKKGAFFTTIGEEKQINPFFRFEVIKDLSGYKGMTSREVFIKVRSSRDNW